MALRAQGPTTNVDPETDAPHATENLMPPALRAYCIDLNHENHAAARRACARQRARSKTLSKVATFHRAAEVIVRRERWQVVKTDTDGGFAIVRLRDFCALRD